LGTVLLIPAWGSSRSPPGFSTVSTDVLTTASDASPAAKRRIIGRYIVSMDSINSLIGRGAVGMLRNRWLLVSHRITTAPKALNSVTNFDGLWPRYTT
jgi:hypothetical protein